ncbi:MAG: methyltransferase domain-containing protein [Alphaproteobacteria bacterium]|nr:methyltransferase domain-containing protein [Alphaproteobacteria bacterium SS10]
MTTELDVKAALKSKYGLNYQIDYVFLAHKSIGFTGKRVLEVGGSLPEGVVFDALEADQWIGVQEPGYWDEFTSLDDAATQAVDRKLIPIGELEDPDALAKRDILLGGIEELPTCLDGYFDAIFSIATFEHILDLPAGLEAMYRALKPGGRLFSMFSPIWSSFNGHHLHGITDKSGRTFWFNDSPIPPWGHLLMTPDKMTGFMKQHTDDETAVEITDRIYNSTAINRLFTEDYLEFFDLEFFDKCPFQIDMCMPMFEHPIAAETQAELERRHPGRKLFNNGGITVVMTRPADA